MLNLGQVNVGVRVNSPRVRAKEKRKIAVSFPDHITGMDGRVAMKHRAL